MSKLRVLVACEFSGIVRNAFNKRGHDAVSCDLLPTESPGPHIQGDVLEILDQGWDMMIAHDPCTYQCNSGVCWLHKDPNRWQLLDESCVFTNKLLSANIPKIARENPIPHKYAVTRLVKKYDQIIHPFMFGHPERKATCLTLIGLPKLKETNNVKAEMLLLPKSQAQRIHYLSPSKDRAKLRSITFPGIAEAFADQWGNL